jgi:hypothetical protein
MDENNTPLISEDVYGTNNQVNMILVSSLLRFLISGVFDEVILAKLKSLYSEKMNKKRSSQLFLSPPPKEIRKLVQSMKQNQSVIDRTKALMYLTREALAWLIVTTPNMLEEVQRYELQRKDNRHKDAFIESRRIRNLKYFPTEEQQTLYDDLSIVEEEKRLCIPYVRNMRRVALYQAVDPITLMVSLFLPNLTIENTSMVTLITDLNKMLVRGEERVRSTIPSSIVQRYMQGLVDDLDRKVFSVDELVAGYLKNVTDSEINVVDRFSSTLPKEGLTLVNMSSFDREQRKMMLDKVMKKKNISVDAVLGMSDTVYFGLYGCPDRFLSSNKTRYNLYRAEFTKDGNCFAVVEAIPFTIKVYTSYNDVDPQVILYRQKNFQS